MMTFFPIPAFTDNYIWVLVDHHAGMFDCVDPGDAAPVMQFAQAHDLALRSILLTHHHHDHIGGVERLVASNPSCTVYGSDDSRINTINYKVHAGQHIQVGLFTFTILFNPGHTATHISYYESQQGWLFCGDTLFSAGCGRVFDGTLEELHHSLTLFKQLPPQTKIFCAHEYTQQNLKFALTVEPLNKAMSDHLALLHQQRSSCSLPSTLATELNINPFLRTETVEVQQYALNHGALSVESLEVFRVLRQQKNIFN